MDTHTHTLTPIHTALPSYRHPKHCEKKENTAIHPYATIKLQSISAVFDFSSLHCTCSIHTGSPWIPCYVCVSVHRCPSPRPSLSGVCAVRPAPAPSLAAGHTASAAAPCTPAAPHTHAAAPRRRSHREIGRGNRKMYSHEQDIFTIEK